MSEKTPNILCFDTALGGITIGLCLSDDKIISHHTETEREQASLLVPKIQEVLKEGELSFEDLDAVACTVGPGSFTGLRIGMTTAKTLGLSLEKPVIGLSTLDLIAQHYSVKENMLIVLETKRKDFYAQYFDNDKNPLTEPFAGSAEDVLLKAPKGDLFVGGNATERFKSMTEELGVDMEHVNYMSEMGNIIPFIMTLMAKEYYDAGNYGDPIEPLYLRDADTSKPKNKPRKLASA